MMKSLFYARHFGYWTRFGIAIMTIGLVLSGCDKSKSVNALLEKARLDREAGNDPAAVIELKNVLAQDPKNQAARLFIAQVYIDIANGNGALGELKQAAQNGADEIHLAKLRAEAELLSGRYEDVVRDTANPPIGAADDLKASLLGYRGAALMALGKRAAARVAFDEGLVLDPHSADLLVALTRMHLSSGNLSEARHSYNEAAKQAPNDPRVVQLEGDIAYAARDYAAANRIYQKIVEKEPWNNPVRANLAATQLALGKIPEAIDIVNVVLDDPDQGDAPQDPILLYVRALAAYMQKDYPTAQEYSENVVKAAPGFGPSRLIAGASSYALHEYERANYYLGRYVFDTPDNKLARKLLAAIQLQLGRAKQSVETLSPLLEKDANDPELLALIGAASARSGDLRGARQYLSQAVDQQPDNANLRVELGRTDIALGDPKAGIDEFKKAAASDPATAIPEVPLFLAYLHTNERDKARSVAEHLAQTEPKNPLGLDMIGTVDIVSGDIAAGRAAFLQAQQISPGDINANRALAQLALADGKIDDARRFYQNALKEHPDDSRTSIDLADLEVRAGRPQEAKAVLANAAKAKPDDQAPLIVLARFQLVQGNTQQSLKTAQQALKAFPQDPALLEIVGRAQLLLGHLDDALFAFKSLVNLRPDSSWAHLELAEAYLARRTPGHPQWSAISEADQAVKLDPQNDGAKVVLARAQISHNRFVEAQETVAALKKNRPDDPVVSELVGMIAAGQGRHADAAAAFSQAIALRDSGLDRRRLAEAQQRLGKPDEAAATLTAWLQIHPEDTETRKVLAVILVNSSKFDAAKVQLVQIVQQDPKDAIMQNNLAWTLSRLGQREEALVHAKQAVALDPHSADSLDTLGTILLENGASQEAIDNLQQAHRMAPGRPEIGLHLSQALIATGNTTGARDVLTKLLATKPSFKDRAEAEKLLQQVGG